MNFKERISNINLFVIFIYFIRPYFSYLVYSFLIRKEKGNFENISQSKREVIINDFSSDLDIIAITSFFNPSGYKNKKENFDKFRDRLKKQKVPLIVVECVFGDSEYELKKDDAEIIVRVKSNSRIWQKERLLNIAIEHIPKQFTKFASLDCDILFENQDWAKETSKMLDKYLVVQPFEYSYRLKKEEFSAPNEFEFGMGEGQSIHCFGKAINKEFPRKILSYLKGGHTGFAWAFNRNSFPGFYDKLITGSGDRFLAYSFFGIDNMKYFYGNKLKKDKEKIYEFNL